MAEASTVIYWAAGCPYCLRAQIALHECDVPYKSHIVDLWAGDQKTKAIKALNPRGTVPIIVDEGPVVVYDSLAAVSWIQERHGARDQSLMPPSSDLRQRAQVCQRLEESQNLASKVTGPIVMKLHHGDKPMTPEDETRFNDLVAKLRTELGYWESYLTPNLHVAGNEYTVADIATEPFLLLADHMGATFSDFPHVKQYVERVKGRKAVAKALQLHKEAGMAQKDLFGGAV